MGIETLTMWEWVVLACGGILAVSLWRLVLTALWLVLLIPVAIMTIVWLVLLAFLTWLINLSMGP